MWYLAATMMTIIPLDPTQATQILGQIQPHTQACGFCGSPWNPEVLGCCRMIHEDPNSDAVLTITVGGVEQAKPLYLAAISCKKCFHTLFFRADLTAVAK